MKVCGISDLHGQLTNVHIKECDILCICGDIVPLRMQNDIQRSDEWFKNVFIPWCQKIKCNQIYLIGGNHDFFLENRKRIINEYLLNTKIIYLDNEAAEYFDNGRVYEIWGTPLCHVFGNWAFMHSPEYEASEFEKIPKDIDILLTHDAALNRSDVCLEFSNSNHIGNKELLDAVEKKKPKLHMFGHLHSADHNLVNYDGTETVCVSMLNERYECVYKPFYIDI